MTFKTAIQPWLDTSFTVITKGRLENRFAVSLTAPTTGVLDAVDAIETAEAWPSASITANRARRNSAQDMFISRYGLCLGKLRAELLGHPASLNWMDWVEGASNPIDWAVQRYFGGELITDVSLTVNAAHTKSGHGRGTYNGQFAKKDDYGLELFEAVMGFTPSNAIVGAQFNAYQLTNAYMPTANELNAVRAALNPGQGAFLFSMSDATVASVSITYRWYALVYDLPDWLSPRIIVVGRATQVSNAYSAATAKEMALRVLYVEGDAGLQYLLRSSPAATRVQSYATGDTRVASGRAANSIDWAEISTGRTTYPLPAPLTYPAGMANCGLLYSPVYVMGNPEFAYAYCALGTPTWDPFASTLTLDVSSETLEWSGQYLSTLTDGVTTEIDAGDRTAAQDVIVVSHLPAAPIVVGSDLVSKTYAAKVFDDPGSEILLPSDPDTGGAAITFRQAESRVAGKSLNMVHQVKKAVELDDPSLYVRARVTTTGTGYAARNLNEVDVGTTAAFTPGTFTTLSVTSTTDGAIISGVASGALTDAMKEEIAAASLGIAPVQAKTGGTHTDTPIQAVRVAANFLDSSVATTAERASLAGEAAKLFGEFDESRYFKNSLPDPANLTESKRAAWMLLHGARNRDHFSSVVVASMMVARAVARRLGLWA